MIRRRETSSFEGDDFGYAGDSLAQDAFHPLFEGHRGDRAALTYPQELNRHRSAFYALEPYVATV